MANALMGTPQVPHRLGKPKFPKVDQNTELRDLVGPQSRYIFTRLGIKTDWLSQAVTDWPDHPSYQEVKMFLEGLKVTNDVSERAIKLATDFAHVITKDPFEKQRLFQVVEYHRRKFSNFKKTTLNL